LRGSSKRRVLLIVLDSCGVGGDPNAAEYGDQGADTLAHTAQAAGGLELPNLRALGLGNISAIPGVPAAPSAQAAWGRMQEQSLGKDTTTGHWEIAGLITREPFRVFENGFPQSLIDEFSRETKRPVVGNKAASGTVILDELGEEQLRSGAWIVYTSADSVFQIAAHEEKIPLSELYAACKVARRLCDPLRVARIIARPFVGEPGAFKRTYNRHDFGMPPPGPTLLDLVHDAKLPCIGVGKISDIFSGRGLTESIHTEGNADGMEKTIERFARMDSGLLFVNLIDFDMLYGHRRNPQGFASALLQFDEVLPKLLSTVSANDLLLITADHGNDPTYSGTDHTREQVPILAYGPPRGAGKDLGVRGSFADVAATVAEALGVPEPSTGKSFYQEIA
jgi:phosphopentomutase